MVNVNRRSFLQLIGAAFVAAHLPWPPIESVTPEAAAPATAFLSKLANRFVVSLSDGTVFPFSGIIESSSVHHETGRIDLTIMPTFDEQTFDDQHRMMESNLPNGQNLRMRTVDGEIIDQSLVEVAHAPSPPMSWNPHKPLRDTAGIVLTIQLPKKQSGSDSQFYEYGELLR